MIEETDVLIIGCGLAGAISALEIAKQGLRVTLIASGKGSSYRAQGGISYQTSHQEDSKLSEPKGKQEFNK